MKHKARSSTLIEPPQLTPAMLSDTNTPLELHARERYAMQLWMNLHLDANDAEELSFEQLIVRNVSFQHAQLRLLESADCRFENCDFAEATLEKTYMRRNEFLGCRMLGLKLMDADLQDVIFSRCNAQLIRIWTSTFKSVRFEHCNFREASFDGSDLSGVVFYKCDLSQADLRNTRLKGSDMRGSTITGIQVQARDLAGVIIDPGQALDLIQLFGITVQAQEA